MLCNDRSTASCRTLVCALTCINTIQRLSMHHSGSKEAEGVDRLSMLNFLVSPLLFTFVANDTNLIGVGFSWIKTYWG